MKYFKIGLRTYFELDRVPSRANGDNVPNADTLFRKMKDGEKFNLPVLDYFFLQSFDKKEFWEWILCDVYSFTHNAGWIRGWFISDDLKLLLENFNLSNPYGFYPSKLLYKGKKIDYYVFQFTGDLTYKQTLDYINYPASIFLNPETNTEIIVSNKDNFLSEWDKVYKENKSLAKTIRFKKLILKEQLDFFPIGTIMKDNIVSERLKNAIEENSIEGFEFSELDYEVVVEK